LLEDKFGIEIDPVHPDGDTPLKLAAMSGSVETVELLLEKGASMMGGEKSRNNVLTTAIMHGKKLVKKQFLYNSKWCFLWFLYLLLYQYFRFSCKLCWKFCHELNSILPAMNIIVKQYER
jgi:hypothetical protein